MKKYIIYVSTNIKKDGAEKSLVSLQSYLNKDKNIGTITIIPQHGPIEELLQGNGIEYIIHSFQGNVNAGRGVKPIRGLTKMGLNIIQAFKLGERLKRKKICIVGVHSNTITSEFGVYLALDLKVPHIWHVREFGKLDFNFDFELGFKYLVWCASKSSKIICNSKSVMNYYEQYFHKNITYVYNGVDTFPQGLSDWESKKFKMILVGRLSPEKGQLLAIEACKELKDSGFNNFVLDLYGDGVDKEKLKDKVHQYGLEKYVSFLGYQNNIPFSSYHLGLMCSQHEAFGRVTVEYMVNSLPVVGVDSGGTSEIVANGISGFLCDDNAGSIFEAIKKFYLDRNLCISFGKAGREIALTKFSVDQYRRNIIEIYNEVFLGGRAI